MIRIFYGDNRVQARQMIERQLGKDFEVIEAENLQSSDLPSVFLGTSLFGETRSILVKDLSINKECWDELPKYVNDSTHNIVIWEAKVDKRSVSYKALVKNKNVEFKEFRLAEDPNKKKVFDIFDVAMRGDGKGAIKLCEQIETTNDPFMFIGLMVSQGIKKLQYNNAKAAKALKILAEADLNMKTTSVESWEIIKLALMEISVL